MRHTFLSTACCRLLAALLAATNAAGAVDADKPAERAEAAASAASVPKAHIDHSGRKQHGRASYYSHRFTGKKMADGTSMNPESNSAASKTLPLGTTAKVTNLRNGKTAVVRIRDRGPYVRGRIVDVTPQTARQLGIGEKGVAPVEVSPIEVPQTDGSVKPGAAASAPG